MQYLDIGFWDIVDILLVGLLIFQLYKLLRGSLAFNIFVGLLVVYLMSSIVNSLGMNMLGGFLQKFVGSNFILLIVVVFQQEVRRFLFYIGRWSGIGKKGLWKNLFNRNFQVTSDKDKVKEELIRAVNNMSNAKTGGLLVFVDASERRFFTDTGVGINADISSKLLESIFDKNSPLHDGAMVVTNNRILSAGCVLPVSENPDLPTRVGMRHRAAVGVTEQIDADVIIISEETGKISHAHKGKLQVNITQNKLAEIADKVLID